MVRLLRTWFVMLIVAAVSATGFSAGGAMAMGMKTVQIVGARTHDATGSQHSHETAIHDHRGASDADHGLVGHDGAIPMATDSGPCPAGTGHGHGDGNNSCCTMACHIAMLSEIDIAPFVAISRAAEMPTIETGLNSGMLTAFERPPRHSGV